MNRKHYKYSTHCYRNKISSSFIGSFTYEVCDIINGEYITYYVDYQWRAFEDDMTWYRIYVDRSLYDIFKEIYKLTDNFSIESIEKTLKDYPNLISVWCHKFTGQNESISSGIDDSRYGVGSDESPTCDLYIVVYGSLNNHKNEKYYISKLLEKYELIKKECANFHYTTDFLELSDYRKFELEIERLRKENKNVNKPKYSRVERYLLLAAAFGLKFAVKSIGADINIDLPVDIDLPDIDTDIDADIDYNSDISSFNGDSTIEFDNGNTVPNDNNDIFSEKSSSSNYGEISFGHAPNDGTYMKTNQDVNIQVAGGNDKGSYDVYLHNGDKYIDFKDQWVKIQGKTRFHLLGNDYIIKG